MAGVVPSRRRAGRKQRPRERIAELEPRWPDAAASLHEALAETLVYQQRGLPAELANALGTTERIKIAALAATTAEWYRAPSLPNQPFRQDATLDGRLRLGSTVGRHRPTRPAPRPYRFGYNRRLKGCGGAGDRRV